MQLKETLTVAVDALRANKMRAVLTSIGVIIGSASIVLVVTVALTSRKYVISQIEAVGSNLVWAEMIKTPDKEQPLSHRLTLWDMAALKETIPGVVTAAGITDIPMTVVVEGRTRPVSLIGVTDGYQQIRRLVILRGRYFDEGDMETHSKVCLVTQDLALRVFGVDNPIGGTSPMGECAFTLFGGLGGRQSDRRDHSNGRIDVHRYWRLSRTRGDIRPDGIAKGICAHPAAADEVLHRTRRFERIVRAGV